MEGSKVKLHMF